MKAELVLAWMLSLQPPGASVYSVVPVAETSPRPCAEATVLCDPPKWSAAHRSHVRYETWAEGLPRYWTIAQSIAATGSAARAVLTVTYHESGWRRDTHSGVGKWARGDQGRSYCLGQMLLGKTNPAGPKLEGVGRAATDRCIAAAVRHLGAVDARNAYAKFARYGGVWASGDKRILARVRTYQRLAGAAPKLPAAVRKALDLPAVVASGHELRPRLDHHRRQR